MSENLLQPGATLTKLTCDICNNYLSYFPIFLSNAKNICGRCTVHNNSTRNEVFEVLAAFQIFPCRYREQGCLKEFLPKDIPQHEKTCPVRIVSCPLFKCAWKDAFPNVIKHCQQEHSKLILHENEEFDIDLGMTYELDNLLIHDQKVFITKWLFDFEKKNLECLITYQEDEIEKTNYSCQFTLKFENRSSTITFDVTKTNYTKLLYLEMLENQLDTPKITGCLFLGPSPEQNAAQIHKEKTNLEMLSVLKCSNCTEYVLPPIFDNSNGLIYCKSCSLAQINQCPQEDTDDSLLPNICLTNLANLIEYPCKFSKNGCKFSGKPSLIKNHHQECNFRDTKCIFSNTDCSWEGQQQNVATHIQSTHQFLNSGAQLQMRNWGTEILKFAGFFFRLVFTINRTGEHYYWAVQTIDATAETFKFEIELLDVNKNGDRFIMRKSCAKLVEKTDSFVGDDSFCYLSRNQVINFLTGAKPSNLAFKVHMYKDIML